MMLQSLNSGMNSKILRGLFGLLLLAALGGLVLTDVGGFFRDGGFSRTDLVKVGNTPLTVQQFDPLYRRQLQTAGIGPDQARAMGLPNMILQQEITRQTLLQAAKRVGITVSDAYVANSLKKQLKFVPTAGTDRDKLNAVLQSVGLSEAEFVQAIKGDTSAQLLSNTISSQVTAVPALMQNTVLAAASQQRQAEIVTIKQADLPAIPAPSDEALKNFLNENKTTYQIPETRDVTIATIAQDKLSPPVTIDPADIKAYYDANGEQFMAPARVRFTQAIAPDEAAAKAIFEAAQKDATPDLKQLAAARSAQYVKSDLYDQTGLPVELADALFAKDQMKRTGLLPPIKSAIGWHVVQTENYQPAGQKSFDIVKADIAELLKQEKLDSDINKVLEDIDNQAGDGTPLAQIVQPYQGQVMKVTGLDKVTARDKIAALKLPEDAQGNVVEAAMTLNDGDTSPIIETTKGAGNGTYLLVHVDKVTAPAAPDFAMIRPTLVKDWVKQQRDAQLDTMVDAVIGDYDSKNPAVKTIADKRKLPYRQTAFLAADSKELPPAALGVLFNLSPQNDLTSVRTDEGALVVRLAGIKLSGTDDIKPSDKQRKELRTTIAGELQQQFVMGWRDALGVDVNQDLLDKTYLNTPKKDED